MDQYQYHVARLMVYLAERKLCASSRASHQKCYEEFGAFLCANNLLFTEDASAQWILSISNTHTRQQCYFWQKYMQQLQVFIELGTIPDELFFQIQSTYDKVPAVWKDSLNQYLEFVRNHYTKQSFEYTRRYCSSIILFFYRMGIVGIEDITFKTIDSLYHENFNCHKATWYIYMSHARSMLSYWASKKLCPAEFGMLWDERVYYQAGTLEAFADDSLA